VHLTWLEQSLLKLLCGPLLMRRKSALTEEQRPLKLGATALPSIKNTA
jgi:hypothetical protein